MLDKISSYKLWPWIRCGLDSARTFSLSCFPGILKWLPTSNHKSDRNSSALAVELDKTKSPTGIVVSGVTLDSKVLVRQLRNDLKDDWFPDPLEFSDMLEPTSLAKSIALNLASNGGTYKAARRTVLNIPKSGFTLRYALETSINDRALYQGLAGFLLPYYDRLLPWNAFSHRYDYEKLRSRDKYTFKHGIQSWKHFVGSARSAISPTSFLLSTDVANYFENIHLGRLEEAMRNLEGELGVGDEELERIRAHRGLLFQLLKSWSYDEERGLPQNRDASSFLANIYMRSVDLAMTAAGFADTYFRYMDDIKIVCVDEFEARAALKKLSLNLREIGLSVNSKKTQIVSGLKEKDIERCLDGSSDHIERIDELWRRRTRQAIFSLWPLLRDRTLDLIAADEVDSREFRYCIKRIELLAGLKDLHFPNELYQPITAAICEAVAKHPACTDQYAKYLEAVSVTADEMAPIIKYLCNSRKAIYTWQNYRLWLLMAYKKLVDDELIEAAEVAVRGEDNPVRAGASIYLGVVGGLEKRQLVATEFSKVSTFLGQRSAIIAMHELPFRDVENLIRGSVRADMHGVYRALGARDRKGKYFAPKVPQRLDLIGDGELAYE